MRTGVSTLPDPQATAELHQQLRHGSFRVYEANPRMLPRLYEPTRRDVDCSIKTPAKEAAAGKRGRSGKAGEHGDITYAQATYNPSRPCRKTHQLVREERRLAPHGRKPPTA